MIIAVKFERNTAIKYRYKPALFYGCVEDKDMRKKMIITGLMISTLLLFTGCNNQIDETVTTTEVDSVIEDIESESTDDSIETPTEEIVDTTEETEQQVSEELVTEESEESTEQESVEQVSEENTDICNNTIPEDEVQWYLDTFGLTREQFNKLTDEQISQMAMDWLNSGGGSGNSSGGSSGGGNSSGGSTPGFTEDGGLDEGVWGPVPELVPGTVEGYM